MTTLAPRPSAPAGTLPEQPRPRRSRWIWLASGAAVAVLGAASTGYAVSRPDEKPEAAATKAEGPFSLTPTGTECDVPTVGPDGLRQSAEGTFCLVSVSVTNSGGEPVLLDGGAQRVTDTAGHTYPIADQASVFLNDSRPSLLDEIAPGATVHGVLPFDVPAGTRLDSLLLHESTTSNGVRVPLSSFQK